MENERDQLDEQIKTVIQSEGLDKAPEGFSFRVMDQIRKESIRVPHTPPIISPRQWAGIAAFVVGVIMLSFNSNGNGGWEWMENVQWQSNQIALSSTFVYALSIFTVFIGIQFYFIKHKLDEIYE